MPSSYSLRNRRSAERARWPERSLRAVRPLSLFVAVVACLVIVGWLFALPRLTQLAPGLQSMKFNTAVSLLLLALAHLFVDPRRRRVLLVLALVLPILSFIEYLAKVDLGIDRLVVDDPGSASFPGRPSSSTVLCLILLPTAGLLVTWGRRVGAQWLTVVPMALGFIAIYGYAYGVSTLYEIGPYSSMAVHTAICVVVMSFVVLMSVPQGVVQWIAFGQDPGAALQRLLIPVALLVLPAGGWLRVQGQKREIYDIQFGTALMVSFVAVILISIGLVSGRTAARIDRERETLIDELSLVNRELEDRIRVRSLQLNRQRTKLALLDERDRIARDLHDRVIQRIFAAGLQMSSLSRIARKSGTEVDLKRAESLDVVATELDLAIRELRNSIFQLTSIEDHDNLEQVIRDVATRASRILGFMPQVEVSGDTADVSVDLVAQIASVIQEALSNVARHAQATEAAVVLLATDDEVEVRVTDDGIGLPEPLQRSSGISNLMGRARALGGSATWGNREPHGTVLIWRVPRDTEPLDDLQLRAAQGRPTSLQSSPDREPETP